MAKRRRNVWHIDDASEDVPDETHACPPCKKKFRHKFQGGDSLDISWTSLTFGFTITLSGTFLKRVLNPCLNLHP